MSALQEMMKNIDNEVSDLVAKSALEPMFVALAEKCVDQNGIFTEFIPTVTLCAPSALDKRIILAKRFHIHTIFTVHNTIDKNLSQDVNINESILILRRCEGTKPPTRFINLDRFPDNEEQLHSFFESLEKCKEGELPKDWGNISFWPRERIERGDWTPAIWRSPELAEAAATFAECELPTLDELELKPFLNANIIVSFEESQPKIPLSFPILHSKGEDGQTTIQSMPDKWRIHRKRNPKETGHFLSKASHLLINFGQRNGTARLVAVAGNEKYIGTGWLPVGGLTADQAKALAVFLNSTAGRIQLLRNMGQTLEFPVYAPAGIANIRVPDVINNGEVCRLLKACWEETRNIRVPQYRDGDGFDGQNHPREKVREAKFAEFQSRQSEREKEKSGAEMREREKQSKGESGAVKEEIGKDGDSMRHSFIENPRPIWDKCVAKTLTARKGGGKEGKAENGGRGLSAEARRLFRLPSLNHLRRLLHREPHIRGKSYNEHSDE